MLCYVVVVVNCFRRVGDLRGNKGKVSVRLRGADIKFMDSTTAQLEGCRVITGMRLSHNGSFDDGLVKLRNTAVRINANRIIPLRFVESPMIGAPHHFSAKMVRCPDVRQEAQNG